MMTKIEFIKLCIAVFCAYNLVVFITYGLDKKLARKRKQRISEKALLLLAFFGGGIGAYFGMFYFRHKTKHWKFKILVPLMIIMQIGVFYYI